MNKKLSAIAIHPQSEYDSSMISWFNSLNDIDRSINLKFFSSSFDIVNADKKFPILPIYEAKYEYGNFFVWDILSLELAINFPNINKIYYFQNKDIPWTKIYNINYEDWSQLFDNPKVEILTHDATIQEIFNLSWKPIKLLDVTPEALYEII
jgi:hypothetical protein